MNAIIWFIVGSFICMIVGFLLQLFRAWVIHLSYRKEKNIALKNNAADSWIYKI